MGALALGAAMLGLALAYGIDGLVRSSGDAANEWTVTRSLGGHELSIPQSWLRAEQPATAGFAKQIELSLTRAARAGGRDDARWR